MLQKTATQLVARPRLVVLPLLCLVLVSLSLYLGRDKLMRIPLPTFPLSQEHAPEAEPATPVPSAETVNATAKLSSSDVISYVDSIMDASATTFPRLRCPPPKAPRYQYLRPPSDRLLEDVKYYFALDLTKALDLLPQLIGSVVETIRFLGPENCALSIIEGNSDDGTDLVLRALQPRLDALTTTYYFRSSSINPLEGDRIGKLAELRNMALQPLLDDSSRYNANTTVVFLNDVAICAEDILELIHQRHFLEADMSCAFDWTYLARDPTFYDVWIARDMKGNSFFEIPPDGNWNSAWNLFWNNPDAQARFSSHRPFQAFSCWNGAAAFSAAPLIDEKVAFRGPREGECFQGEPQIFCKELWFNGYGKIAVVPSINLEYSLERGKDIKEAKGYTSQWLPEDGTAEEDDKIQWQLEPPQLVKCMESYENQTFRPWNETLG